MYFGEQRDAAPNCHSEQRPCHVERSRNISHNFISTNRLYFGDNLEWLRDRREFPNASIALVQRAILMIGPFTALLHNARKLCQLNYRGRIVPQEEQTKFRSKVPIQCYRRKDHRDWIPARL